MHNFSIAIVVSILLVTVAVAANDDDDTVASKTFLFFPYPDDSHVQVALSLAQEMNRRGHCVYFATTLKLKKTIVDYGFKFIHLSDEKSLSDFTEREKKAILVFDDASEFQLNSNRDGAASSDAFAMYVKVATLPPTPQIDPFYWRHLSPKQAESTTEKIYNWLQSQQWIDLTLLCLYNGFHFVEGGILPQDDVDIIGFPLVKESVSRRTGRNVEKWLDERAPVVFVSMENEDADFISAIVRGIFRASASVRVLVTGQRFPINVTDVKRLRVVNGTTILRRSVLCHNSTKLFVTRGESVDIAEAFSCQKPVLIIPSQMYRESHANAVLVKLRGVGDWVDTMTSTEEEEEEIMGEKIDFLLYHWNVYNLQVRRMNRLRELAGGAERGAREIENAFIRKTNGFATLKLSYWERTDTDVYLLIATMFLAILLALYKAVAKLLQILFLSAAEAADKRGVKVKVA